MKSFSAPRRDFICIIYTGLVKGRVSPFFSYKKKKWLLLANLYPHIYLGKILFTRSLYCPKHRECFFDDKFAPYYYYYHFYGGWKRRISFQETTRDTCVRVFRSLPFLPLKSRTPGSDARSPKGRDAIPRRGGERRRRVRYAVGFNPSRSRCAR